MTRPAERIPAILKVIQSAWEESPDLRFGQLLENMGGISFYEEDNDFLERFGEFYGKDKMVWGTRGKDGNSPLTYKPISELEASHIENILITQQQISEDTKKLLTEEFLKRKRDERGIKTLTPKEIEDEKFERHKEFVLHVLSTQP